MGHRPRRAVTSWAALRSRTAPCCSWTRSAPAPVASLRIREALAAGAPGFGAIQGAITAYLDAERRLARVPEGTDTAALALALVGTVHHLLMSGWPGAPDPVDQIRRLVVQLAGGGR